MNKQEKAKTYLNQGKWNQAEKLCQKIVNEEPDNSEALYFLAISLLNQNKLHKVIENINKALEIDGNKYEYLEIKGSTLARLGQTDEAMNVLLNALKYNPNSYYANITVAQLYFFKDNKVETVKYFTRANKVSQNNPEAGINLAKIKMYNGNIQEAIKELKELENKFPESIEIKLMIGQALVESGAYSIAESYFEFVMGRINNPNIAELYLGVAKIYSNNTKEAEDIIQRFNEQYPNTKEGFAAIGILLYKTKNYELAFEYLTKAINTKLVPISWKITLMECLINLGSFKQAEKFYKEIESNYDVINVSFRLAEIYEMQKKTSKSKKQYKKIKKNDAKYAASLLGLSRIYLLDEKVTKAEQTILKFLNKVPKHGEGTVILILSLLYQEKQYEALDILENINYKNYSTSIKKTFRTLHGLIFDNQRNYNKAMNVFIDESKNDNKEKNEKSIKVISQEIEEVKKAQQGLEENINQPIFVVGSNCTIVDIFNLWLNVNNITVLNDRLYSLGREDFLNQNRASSTIFECDNESVVKEQTNYEQKIKELLKVNDIGPFVDCLYLSAATLLKVKKVFPKATVLLLTRDSADIWLHQKIFGKEDIDSKDWNETINQIISMDFNLIQVDIDKWLNNDKKVIESVGNIFSKSMTKVIADKSKYWQKHTLPKGHWKNYKMFLGQ